ncbi:MAG: cytochrome P450, partial [Anaerolineae bacterium]|nr:cytochrome P450 [Anaerolineae bacterium]
FGGGPRVCIGNNFAMMEMQIAVATIAQHYTFELMPNQQIEPEPLVTMRPKYGIHMRLCPRA